jgi:bifunctional oligoribonuclease and PAP phosphatase NrnA
VSTTPLALATREHVLRAIRADDRFVLVTHEHPDGDALGSLVAMQSVLRGLGKDSVMMIAPEDLPLPKEYRFFALDGLATEPPPDFARRTAIFLDCGNPERTPFAELREVESLLNIDHHHDNTRFGTVNHVVEDASCTAELVWGLLPDLNVELTPQLGEALYVGLVTDTGRFSYENTTPRAHLMAAELIEAGVDVAAVYRQVYEGVPAEKLALLARALGSIERFDDGRLTVAMLTNADFTAAHADSSDAEGIIDQLRSVADTKVAALIRETCGRDTRGSLRVSLRATDDEVDVSAIARAFGGGGHRRAAAFSSDLDPAELIDAIRAQV